MTCRTLMLVVAAVALAAFGACSYQDVTALRTAPAPADLTVTVDWTGAIGVAGSLAYGVNGTSVFDPSVSGLPGKDAYRVGLANTGVGFVRAYKFESMEDSAHTPSGWILAPESTTPRWDRDKIHRALAGTTSFNPERMITIPHWPSGLGSRASPLASEYRTTFLDLCADLVRVVNLEEKRAVRYWEVTSQLDGAYAGAGTELGQLVAAAARAMKAIDPSIRVGGPGLQNAWSAELSPFLRAAVADIDFLSYHSYSFGGGSAAHDDVEIGMAAADLTAISQNARLQVQKVTQKSLELFHDEIAFTSDSSDRRLQGMLAALFDVSALLEAARGGATGAAIWNDASSDFGLLDVAFSPRPAALAFRLLNGFFRGTLVPTLAPTGSAVAVYGVRGPSRRALALVHFDEHGPLRVRVVSTGAGSGPYAVQVLDGTGLHSHTLAAANLTAPEGIALPPSSMTVIVDGNATADPTP